MQLAVTHEGVPHTWTWSRSATGHTVGCTAHSRTTCRSCHNSVALQCDGRRALVVGRGVAEQARRVVLVGFWVVVVGSRVRATQDDASGGELKLTASRLVGGEEQEVVIGVGLEGHEGLHRTGARASHQTTSHEVFDVVASVALQHHEAEVVVADVGGVEQERVVVRAVEGEEHTVRSLRASVPSVNLLSVGTAEVAHEGLTSDLSHGVLTLVVGWRSGDRGVTRSRDHEVAAAVSFHADVVVHTSHGRPCDGAVEASLTSVAVGGNASQRSVHVLGEDRDVSACGVVCLRVVQWGVASADSDLLIGVGVEDVPHACSAQHVVAVLEAFQSFSVGGVLDGTCRAQTASQSFRVSHVVVGGRQLARAVVHARRRIVVDARWVGATFEAALASQGEVKAVFLTCAHSGVSSAELVGQLDAHLTWVNVIQHLEVVATRSQAHVVSADVQTVTCEGSGD